jgi:hypothetical protein
LAVKPKYDGDIEIKIDDMGATHGWQDCSRLVFIKSIFEELVIVVYILLYYNFNLSESEIFLFVYSYIDSYAIWNDI